jgi:hypothetical protein
MERRKFMKGAGILGSVLGGIAATKVVVENHYHETKQVSVDPPKEDISHLAPSTTVQTLQLQANNDPPKTNERMRLSSDGGFMFTPTTQYTNRVTMSVGKDDRLWIKVGDEWKRVVLEG